jgi:hypothetical protein
LGLVLIDGLSKKPDPTLNTSRDLILMNINHTLMILLRLKSWNLRLGTKCEQVLRTCRFMVWVIDHWPLTIYKCENLLHLDAPKATELDREFTFLHSNRTQQTTIITTCDPVHFFPPVAHEPHVFQCKRHLSSY